jgi:hypothetical protein
MITKAQALVSLRPNAQWSLSDDDIAWLDSIQTQPTETEIQNEITRLQAEYDAKEYQRKRASEFPPITDYIDGVVKGDQAQIDKYIADCLAVKARHPKGVK